MARPSLNRVAATDVNKRTELNLLGKTDTQGGESRRNENVQFNLIDNNALKELNIRLGTTATLIEEFKPNRTHSGPSSGTVPALRCISRPRANTAFTAGSTSLIRTVSSVRAPSSRWVTSNQRARRWLWAGRWRMALGQLLHSRQPATSSWQCEWQRACAQG